MAATRHSRPAQRPGRIPERAEDEPPPECVSKPVPSACPPRAFGRQTSQGDLDPAPVQRRNQMHGITAAV
jgi:hypothetical protein